MRTDSVTRQFDRRLGRVRHGMVAASVLASLGLVAASQPNIAAAATTRTAAWPAGWTNPLTGKPGGTLNVTTNFGAYSLGCANADRTHWYTYYLDSGYKAHLGLDIAQAAGQPVRAIGAGRIMYSGQKWGTGNGHVVLVQHRTADGTSFVVTYGHLASPVTSGTVVAGQQVGVIASGLAGGDHLHLGLRPGTGTTEQPTILDARVSGTTCGLSGNTAGMVDPINYLTPRQSPGGTLSIQSLANASYVRPENAYTGTGYGMLRAASTGVSALERFRLVGDCRATSGCAILSLANGRYVSTELGYSGAWHGLLRARATSAPVSGWERFRITGDCASNCAVQSVANARFVSAELNYTGSGAAMLRARATTAPIGGWEQFRMRPAS